MTKKSYSHQDFEYLKENFRLPINKNLARNTRAKLFIQRCPDTNFFCSTFAIPEFSLEAIQIGTSTFNPLQEPGEQFNFQPLTINLLVDENFENWLELLRWFNYVVRNGSVPDSYSNALAVIYNSEMQPIISIHLFSIFPMSIGTLEFNTSDSEILVLPVSFSFLEMEIERISTREEIFKDTPVRDLTYPHKPWSNE